MIGTVIVAMFSLELLSALIWPVFLPEHHGLGDLLASIGNLNFLPTAIWRRR